MFMPHCFKKSKKQCILNVSLFLLKKCVCQKEMWKYLTVVMCSFLCGSYYYERKFRTCIIFVVRNIFKSFLMLWNTLRMKPCIEKTENHFLYTRKLKGTDVNVICYQMHRTAWPKRNITQATHICKFFKLLRGQVKRNRWS